jgi:RNA polymerase sigma-70 factor (ECF subfamily)
MNYDKEDKKLNQYSDKDLIELFLSNSDYKAVIFEVLVIRYQKLIFKICSGFFNDKAQIEDLAQESFVKAYTYLPSLYNYDHFKSWLVKITLNLCRDKFNKLKKQQEIHEILKQSTDSNLSEPALSYRLEYKEIIDELLNKLSDKEKLIISLFYLSDCTIKEISQSTGLGESAIKMKLKRIKDKYSKKYGGLM